MADPIIFCPKCKTEIRLTEQLGAPLIEPTRKDYEQRLAEKELEYSQQDASLRQRERDLKNAQQTLDDQVAERMRQESLIIVEKESRKAKLGVAADLERKANEIAELHETLRQRDHKLGEAQKVQADFMRKRRDLENQKRELDLTVERRVAGRTIFTLFAASFVATAYLPETRTRVRYS